VFTPLLASTCTGTVEFRSVIEPIRRLNPATNYYQAHCTSVDFGRKVVHCRTDKETQFALPYDRLVLAAGARSSTFDIAGVQEHAFFLKEIEDARRVRFRILDCFERAKWPGISRQQQRDLLHFAVVGGGPTGVEFAAELNDLVQEDLRRYYPDLAPLVRITVYDVASRILGAFDRRLADFAMNKFARSGIAVATGTRIQRVEADGIVFADGTRRGVGMIVWATGLATLPFVQELGRELLMDGRRFRLLTNERLQVQSRTGGTLADVYAIGDCATIASQDLPCTAQVALQKAQHLAGSLERPAPFVFAHRGMMAYVGGWQAVADVQAGTHHLEGSGRLAWLLWRSAYFVMTVSWRNKVLIPMYWFLTWAFGRDISRL
jgi:NADH dehydrogenase FAD-containing subunit